MGQITQSFNNIAIEMWINEEEVADFDLDGCEFIHVDRPLCCYQLYALMYFSRTLQWKEIKLSA